MKPSSEISDSFLVPQPYLRRVASVLSALFCFIVGGLGGFAGSSAGRTVWFALGFVWVAWYFWALTVPYVRIAADRVAVRPMPFSGGEASIKSISKISFGDNSVEIRQVDGVTLKTRLSRVVKEQRSDVLSILHGIEERVAEEALLDALELQATWGVDPATQQLDDS